MRGEQNIHTIQIHINAHFIIWISKSLSCSMQAYLLLFVTLSYPFVLSGNDGWLHMHCMRLQNEH